MVLACFRCESNKGSGAAFQDKQYGKGMRVHNETNSHLAAKLLYRCTVCENERTTGQQ